MPLLGGIEGHHIQRLEKAAVFCSTLNFLRKVYKSNRKDIPNNNVVNLSTLNENPNNVVKATLQGLVELQTQEQEMKFREIGIYLISTICTPSRVDRPR